MRSLTTSKRRDFYYHTPASVNIRIFAILDAHGTGKAKSSEIHDYGVYQESASLRPGCETMDVAPDGANVNESEASLQSICGVRLTSVQFVLDYLILGFDAQGALTTLVWPEISSGNTVVRFGMSGYRDRLCELITQVVEIVEFGEDETILIAFENRSLMRIPLRERTAPGERAIFTAPKHKLRVW
jgi:hypothetical protein